MIEEIVMPGKRYTDILGTKGRFVGPNSEVQLHYLLTTVSKDGYQGSRELLSSLNL